MAIHHSHIHVSSDSPVPLFCDHPGIRTKGAYHSLLPISIPKTNPIPMLSSPFTSYTQPELWMHSPLIHRMSYLSSGTIATECSMAQSYSRQKKCSAPIRLWDTASSSISQAACLCFTWSLPHCLSRNYFGFCVFDCRLKWNFYYCGAIDSQSKWLLVSVLAVIVSVCWSVACLLFVHHEAV